MLAVKPEALGSSHVRRARRPLCATPDLRVSVPITEVAQGRANVA
jgi:hypothetical protein